MKKYFKIKTLWLSLGFILIATSMTAQSGITIDASQVFSTFKFKDSQGNQVKDYSHKIGSSFNVGYISRYNSGLLFRASIGTSKAGATMMYDSTNYSWDLQYIGLKAGIGYIFNKDGRLKPYLTVSPYFSYLMEGSQSLNNQNLDIIKMKSLKRSDYGIYIAPGFQIKLSDSFALYAEYNYMMGLKNIENSSDGQKTYNRANTFSLGTVIALKK